MVVLGLTGSIAMGKSTAAAMFRSLRIPVFDADRTAHRLLARGGTGVAPVVAAFPGTERNAAIDRDAVAAKVFADPAALCRLESVLHPLVRREQTTFLEVHARRQASLVVLDIPLLFETAGDLACDHVAVVSAPGFLQLQRMLTRPGMTRDRAAAVLSRQMTDTEKRRRADFIIPSGLGRAFTFHTIKGIVQQVRKAPATHWPPRRHRKT